MKKTSIKIKITLWYTGIVTIVLLLIFLAFYLFAYQLEVSRTRENLEDSVVGFAQKIDISSGSYYIDPDTDFYNAGVVFCVYDKNGHLLNGKMPVEFPQTEKLQSHHSRIIENNHKKWMIYDAVYEYGTGKHFWVRGIEEINTMEQFIRILFLVLLGLFPFFILMIGIIGYFMISRALKPVDVIRTQAEEIKDGSNLSKRLPVPKIKDEMYQLTITFNEMFQRLENSFEDEKQFTADVSHELRTPISVIISHCEYELEKPDLDQEQKDDLQVILNQARKMSILISQLLMIARSERGQENLSFEPVDLKMMAEIVAEEVEKRAKEKDISIIVNADRAVINGNQTLLTRMLLNLLNNAITYGKEKGSIWMTIEEKSDHVIGMVKDNGIGIDQEHLSKIWNRFYQIDSSRSHQEGGTGLGLPMVQWIVHVHKGTITVKSELGKGTEFRFLFPKE